MADQQAESSTMAAGRIPSETPDPNAENNQWRTTTFERIHALTATLSQDLDVDIPNELDVQDLFEDQDDFFDDVIARLPEAEANALNAYFQRLRELKNAAENARNCGDPFEGQDLLAEFGADLRSAMDFVLSEFEHVVELLEMTERASTNTAANRISSAQPNDTDVLIQDLDEIPAGEVNWDDDITVHDGDEAMGVEEQDVRNTST